MVNTIRLDLMKGTVKQDLAQLPEQMLDGAFEAINEAADMVGHVSACICLHHFKLH